MKFKDVSIGDVVNVIDWSGSVNPITLKPDYSYYNTLYNKIDYVVLKKGRFPAEKICGKKRYNNIHIRNNDGLEYYIKSQFVEKMECKNDKTKKNTSI